MSREYVYQQKEKVQIFIEELDKKERDVDVPIIELTEALCKRAILSFALDGHSSLEGIQRIFKNVFRMTISIGKISETIKEASKRAQVFNENIDLSQIRQGANDEIFQGGSPILTGIDPESTFIYLLVDGGDRKADTWELCMQYCKDQGLNLETTINDSGSGLLAGITRVFPEADIQLDTFHSLNSLGKEITKIERKTYAMISEENELTKRAEGKRPKEKTIKKLEQIEPKVKEAIRNYDILHILFCWIRELLSFSGYCLDDTISLIEFALYEIENIAGDVYPALLKQTKAFRKNIPLLLSYITRLKGAMDKSCRVSTQRRIIY